MEQQKLLEEIKQILESNMSKVCYTTFDRGMVGSYKELVWKQIQNLVETHTLR